MKVFPRSDYPVGVRCHGWEVDPAVAPLYDGVFDVILNQMVTVTFVPELGERTRPFQRRELPDNLDEVANPADARLEALIFADRAVTPDADRAGTHERLPLPPWRDADAEPGVVFYLTPAEFAIYQLDLAELSTEHGALYATTPVSSLADHPVIGYVQRLLTDPAFGQLDLVWLRDHGSAL